MFVASEIPRFPGFGFPDSRLPAGMAGSGPGRGVRGNLQGTKSERSKEVGQDRENPISASPAWGNTKKLSSTLATHEFFRACDTAAEPSPTS